MADPARRPALRASAFGAPRISLVIETSDGMQGDEIERYT